FGSYPSETRSVHRMVTRTEKASGILGFFGATQEVRGAVLEQEIVAPAQPSADPTGPATGQYRVVRGGSWYCNYAGNFRCADRFRYTPGYRNIIYGFRLSSPGP
ncbi:MAG: SUMF1/EgtB/PvdO family nonheme iron enzyme, partial [Armatimonadota bacterium]